jgi:undecaprenyl-diphosphatase
VAIVAVGSWAILSGLLVLCGAAVLHAPALLEVDTRITTFVVAHRTPGRTQVMQALTWAGSWIAAASLTALVLLLVWRRRLPPVALPAVLCGWLGELAAVNAVKVPVKRPRPPEALRLVDAHGWSFPSGHTANAVVVFAGTAAMLSTLTDRTLVRTAAWGACSAAAALVGFSRIELGVHWTTDVAAGAGWAILWLLLVRKILHARVGTGRPSLSPPQATTHKALTGSRTPSPKPCQSQLPNGGPWHPPPRPPIRQVVPAEPRRVSHERTTQL